MHLFKNHQNLVTLPILKRVQRPAFFVWRQWLASHNFENIWLYEIHKNKNKGQQRILIFVLPLRSVCPKQRSHETGASWKWWKRDGWAYHSHKSGAIFPTEFEKGIFWKRNGNCHILTTASCELFLKIFHCQIFHRFKISRHHVNEVQFGS